MPPPSCGARSRARSAASPNPRFRPLLVPLMYDANYVVARAAIHSAGTLGGDDFLFVPTLVALLRNRRLKEPAREVLVGYGEDVVPTLAYFMADHEEDIWVRRHVPATLARIPCEASVQGAARRARGPRTASCATRPSTALEQLRRDHPDLAIDAAADREACPRRDRPGLRRAHAALQPVPRRRVNTDCLLARALEEKYERATNRVFPLLGLVHPPADIAAVPAALRIDRRAGTVRARSSSSTTS